MAKPNYSFAKRQRELAKQKKKEEKLQEKIQRRGSKGPTQDDETVESSITAPAPAGADDTAGNT